VIGGCLDALAEMAPSVTAVVIDNASSDRTLEEVRARGGVKIIANRENRGFAAAVNQGVLACQTEQASSEDYLLILNPDARILTALDELVGATREYGLASGALVDKTGRPQKGFTIRRFPTALTFWFELAGLNRLWPSNPVNRRYRYLDGDLDHAGPVEQPAGAFLMFRRDVWQRLGGLDEGFYPVWFEDVDFCRRAAEAGYRIEYIPQVKAEHLGGHSVLQVPQGCRDRYWCASLVRYASGHFGSFAYRSVCMAVVLTSIPRAVAWMMLDRSLTPIRSCIHIVGFAGKRLMSFRKSGEELKRFS
jgi:N-acetylglucosaminyl-diphospho-decaprenol L-rhamnosyltransferase